MLSVKPFQPKRRLEPSVRNIASLRDDGKGDLPFFKDNELTFKNEAQNQTSDFLLLLLDALRQCRASGSSNISVYSNTSVIKNNICNIVNNYNRVASANSPHEINVLVSGIGSAFAEGNNPSDDEIVRLIDGIQDGMRSFGMKKAADKADIGLLLKGNVKGIGPNVVSTLKKNFNLIFRNALNSFLDNRENIFAETAERINAFKETVSSGKNSRPNTIKKADRYAFLTVENADSADKKNYFSNIRNVFHGNGSDFVMNVQPDILSAISLHKSANLFSNTSNNDFRKVNGVLNDNNFSSSMNNYLSEQETKNSLLSLPKNSALNKPSNSALLVKKGFSSSLSLNAFTKNIFDAENEIENAYFTGKTEVNNKFSSQTEEKAKAEKDRLGRTANEINNRFESIINDIELYKDADMLNGKSVSNYDVYSSKSSSIAYQNNLFSENGFVDKKSETEQFIADNRMQNVAKKLNILNELSEIIKENNRFVRNNQDKSNERNLKNDIFSSVSIEKLVKSELNSVRNGSYINTENTLNKSENSVYNEDNLQKLVNFLHIIKNAKYKMHNQSKNSILIANSSILLKNKLSNIDDNSVQNLLKTMTYGENGLYNHYLKQNDFVFTNLTEIEDTNKLSNSEMPDKFGFSKSEKPIKIEKVIEQSYNKLLANSQINSKISEANTTDKITSGDKKVYISDNRKIFDGLNEAKDYSKKYNNAVMNNLINSFINKGNSTGEKAENIANISLINEKSNINNVLQNREESSINKSENLPKSPIDNSSIANIYKNELSHRIGKDLALNNAPASVKKMAVASGKAEANNSQIVNNFSRLSNFNNDYFAKSELQNANTVDNITNSSERFAIEFIPPLNKKINFAQKQFDDNSFVALFSKFIYKTNYESSPITNQVFGNEKASVSEYSADTYIDEKKAYHGLNKNEKNALNLYKSSDIKSIFSDILLNSSKNAFTNNAKYTNSTNYANYADFAVYNKAFVESKNRLIYTSNPQTEQAVNTPEHVVNRSKKKKRLMKKAQRSAELKTTINFANSLSPVASQSILNKVEYNTKLLKKYAQQLINNEKAFTGKQNVQKSFAKNQMLINSKNAFNIGNISEKLDNQTKISQFFFADRTVNTKNSLQNDNNFSEKKLTLNSANHEVEFVFNKSDVNNANIKNQANIKDGTIRKNISNSSLTLELLTKDKQNALDGLKKSSKIQDFNENNHKNTKSDLSLVSIINKSLSNIENNIDKSILSVSSSNAFANSEMLTNNAYEKAELLKLYSNEQNSILNLHNTNSITLQKAFADRKSGYNLNTAYSLDKNNKTNKALDGFFPEISEQSKPSNSMIKLHSSKQIFAMNAQNTVVNELSNMLKTRVLKIEKSVSDKYKQHRASTDAESLNKGLNKLVEAKIITQKNDLLYRVENVEVNREISIINSTLNKAAYNTPLKQIYSDYYKNVGSQKNTMSVLAEIENNNEQNRYINGNQINQASIINQLSLLSENLTNQINSDAENVILSAKPKPINKMIYAVNLGKFSDDFDNLTNANNTKKSTSAENEEKSARESFLNTYASEIEKIVREELSSQNSTYEFQMKNAINSAKYELSSIVNSFKEENIKQKDLENYKFQRKFSNSEFAANNNSNLQLIPAENAGEKSYKNRYNERIAYNKSDKLLVSRPVDYKNAEEIRLLRNVLKSDERAKRADKNQNNKINPNVLLNIGKIVANDNKKNTANSQYRLIDAAKAEKQIDSNKNDFVKSTIASAVRNADIVMLRDRQAAENISETEKRINNEINELLVYKYDEKEREKTAAKPNDGNGAADLNIQGESVYSSDKTTTGSIMTKSTENRFREIIDRRLEELNISKNDRITSEIITEKVLERLENQIRIDSRIRGR